MDIQVVIEQAKTQQLPVEQLRTLAGNSAAFGADVVELFAGQAERRAVAAGDVLKAAENEQRDLLASENRTYQRHMLEADAIRGLQQQVETRTAQRAFVPATQVRTDETRIEIVPAVLAKDQAVSKWLEQRGGFAYAGEHGADRLRLGALIRGMVGHRAGLSSLEQRVLSEGSDSAGGFVVPEVVATRFIDRVRNAMVVQRAGAQIVPMTSDVLHIARLAAGVDAGSPGGTAWKTENDPIGESDLTLERVTFTARTLPVLVRMSVELSEDSVNIDQVIETELSQALALELDRAALLGSGTPPEPDGVLNQTNVTVTAYNATPTNYDFLVDGVASVWAANHDANAIVHNSTIAAFLGKLKDSTGQPLQVPPAIANIPRFRTNQIEGTGSPAGESSVFIGDFTQLLIGMRTSFRLEASRTAGDAFANLQILIRAYLRADVQLQHPQAFCVLTGVDTTV